METVQAEFTTDIFNVSNEADHVEVILNIMGEAEISESGRRC